MDKKYFQKILPYLVLLAIFAFHLSNNFFVIKADNTPLIYDSFDYYYKAKIFFEKSNISSFRPPLISFLNFPLFKLFGTGQKTAVFWFGGFSLIFLLLGTFFLVKGLYSKGVALLSVLILSSFPIIFGHSRSFMSDLLLSGFVVLSVLFMIQSKGFTSRKFTAACGIAFGLGMLAKTSYILYIIGPLVYLLAKETRFDKKVYHNLSIMCLIIFCLCAFWYLPNLHRVMQRYFTIGQFKTVSGLNIKELLGSVSWYIFSLVRFGMYWLWWPFLYTVFLKKIHRPFPVILLIWIAVPYFILSVFEAKNQRFAIPLLPAAAILCALLTLNIKNNATRKAIIVVTIFLGLAQIMFISHPLFKNLSWTRYAYYRDKYYENELLVFGLLRPHRDDWKIREIFDSIKNIPDIAWKRVVFINTRPFITHGLKQNAFEGKFEILIIRNKLCFINKDELSDEFLSSVLTDSNVVLYVQNRLPYSCNNEQRLEKLFMDNLHKYECEDVISLPDGSRLMIYKKSIPQVMRDALSGK